MVGTPRTLPTSTNASVYLFFSFTDLNVPIINWYNIMMNEDMNTVVVYWGDDDCTPKDVKYIVSVGNSTHSDPIKYVTNLKNITLSLMKGIHYTITVTAQLCGGNVTSKSSEPLHLYFPGFYINCCISYLHTFYDVCVNVR